MTGTLQIVVAIALFVVVSLAIIWISISAIHILWLVLEALKKSTSKNRTNLPDKVSDFVGSFKAVVLVLALIIGWVLTRGLGFDQEPYILLNLVLSCLAVLQIPFLLMAQKLQEEKDRARDEQIYRMVKKIHKLVEEEE